MLSATWFHSLRLENRKSPEFILPGTELTGIPHGAIMRQSFDRLGLAAIHCISGVPSVGFLVQNNFDQNKVDQVHKALWNQGFATLLLVITGNTLRAYSLAQIPTPDSKLSEALVQVFDRVNDALELKNLILGIESGRFISDHEERFNANYRIDKVLLNNLGATVNKLVAQDMKRESAQALLMQIMFIAYLEDKEIINAEYFRKATGDIKLDSLKTLLSLGNQQHFIDLFGLLKKHFNGDMFVSPCSFEESKEAENFSDEHIKIIFEFRAGNINSSTGQYQFWPYDFKFIPIDLISAVYDRFLGFDPVKKRESGAYYTPMFLADLVTEQAWAELSEKQKNHGEYVDPSCGSGIFLVRLFEKIIDEWKNNHQGQRPTWSTLLTMLHRLHGFDIKKESVRISAFSLYIALLENTKPAEILALMKKERMLPKLYGESLHVIDFFKVSSEKQRYDLVIGNPPWVSRRDISKSAQAWCKANERNMPAKEIAWGFVWKAISHTNKDCVIAFLLKATSFLTNHSRTFIATRKQWMEEIQLTRIINFADSRFQLFEEGSAPTALIIYKPKNKPSVDDYTFDYWIPKADLNLKTKRLLTLSTMDQAKLPIRLIKGDQLLMKRRMWMQTPDAKLFQYLRNLPQLGEKLITYKHSKKKTNIDHNKWIIGQGFKPAVEENLDKETYYRTRSSQVMHVPHLESRMFQPLVMPNISNDPWHSEVIHSKGFEQGFKSPQILIPQGIEHTEGRLRASYCTQDVSFRSSIQAIIFKKGEEKKAKFLTVLLNSSLVAWFLFHHSSNTGMERDKVYQEQLLDIPFPSAENTIKQSSQKAFDKGVELVDRLLKKKDNLLQPQMSEYMVEIDKIIYQYFGLNKADILLIEDALKHIIPSMQPRVHSKNIPSLWKNTNEHDWKYYSKWLSSGLTTWLKGSSRAVVELTGFSSDLVVIGVHLTTDTKTAYFTNRGINGIDEILSKIWDSLPQNLPGNFHLIPDLRVFIDDVLYLVKPRKLRFWLGSTALADADAIASDLLVQQ